jgi:hypothetical protein
MTEQAANRIANVVIGAAALGLAYAVLRNPKLRRMAVGLAATAAMSQTPEWLRREVQSAWAASASGVGGRRSALS